MSGLIVGLVMRTPVTKKFNGAIKFCAMIYAEHAWPDGTHAHPAVETVARFMGCSDRSVQRHVKVLVKMGMLIPDGVGPRGTNQYRFPFEDTPAGDPRLNLQPQFAGGDNLSPRQIVGGDTESGDTESGDTIVSPKRKNRSLTTTTTGGEAKIRLPKKGRKHPAVKSTPVTARGDDPRFGELVREMEKITGSINMATGDFLGDLLADWQAYLGKLNPYHQDHLIDPYTAVLECIREGVASAKDSRPNHKYLRAILDRWMREGYKSKRPGGNNGSQLPNQKRSSAGQNGKKDNPAGWQPSDDELVRARAAAERINSKRRRSPTRV